MMTKKITFKDKAIQKTGDEKPGLNPVAKSPGCPCPWSTLNDDHPLAAKSMNAEEQAQIIVVATALRRATAVSSRTSWGGLRWTQSQPGDTSHGHVQAVQCF